VKDDQGRIVGASKIARDITERKLSEVRLRDSERRLQELITAVPAAIYTTDAQGKITYFNQAAVDLAGRTPTIGSDEWCVTWKLYRPDGTPLPDDQCPMAVLSRRVAPSAMPKQWLSVPMAPGFPSFRIPHRCAMVVAR
jgi:PAS domain-containing protein